MKQNCPVYKKRQADNAASDKVGEPPTDPLIPKVYDTDKVVTSVNAVIIGVEEDWDQDYNEFSGLMMMQETTVVKNKKTS